jgi:hypothetical protein
MSSHGKGSSSVAGPKAASISKKATDELAEGIIQDPHLFLGLCTVIRAAAERAITREVVAKANDICVLPTMESVERDIIPVCLEATGVASIVKFNPLAMSFVGGAAIHLYNMALKDVLGYDFVRNTPDIDAVWWPEIQLPSNISTQLNERGKILEGKALEDIRVKSVGGYGWMAREQHVAFRGTEYVVVSASPAITALVGSFEAELKKGLDQFLKDNRGAFNAHVSSKTTRKTPPVFEFKTATDHHIKSGVWNVQGNLHFHDRIIKLIEIAVHDGGSSQIPPKHIIEPQVRDPIFLRPITTDVHRLLIAGREYSVPILTKLFDQQFFALVVRFNSLRNRFMGSAEEKKSEIRRKIESHYRRCYYLLFVMRRCLDPSLKPILTDILGFVLHPMTINQFQQSIQNSIEWIASCPETLELCGIRADNPLFAQACNEGIFIKKELCGKSTGPIFNPGNLPLEDMHQTAPSVPAYPSSSTMGYQLIPLSSIAASESSSYLPPPMTYQSAYQPPYGTTYQPTYAPTYESAYMPTYQPAYPQVPPSYAPGYMVPIAPPPPSQQMYYSYGDPMMTPMGSMAPPPHREASLFYSPPMASPMGFKKGKHKKGGTRRRSKARKGTRRH